MKKSILPVVASALLFLSACTNDNSSTVASQDDEQSSTSHSGGTGHQPANGGDIHSQSQKAGSSHGASDTSHTNTTVVKDSAGSLNGQVRSAAAYSNARKAKTGQKTH